MRRPGSHAITAAVLLLTALSVSGGAQAAATVREVRRTFTTYPFDDPDPIARVGRIYPYFRFDGFTSRAVQRQYTVVELENAYLRVSIVPEIGGKIWSAIDKATGRSMVYDNQVVKFRDVAMRGPWTSGGIEANYGIIGHTPNVATPVDYLTRTNADGSVSCIIGALDLLTRTSWRLEITLPADKAFFTTSSHWYNASALEQPYYTWMNAAIPARDDLEFIYPGNRTLGHDGELGDWPVNRSNGKLVSLYRNNDFGGYKSYHVFGTYSEFVGAYWHDQDFGMVRYAAHDEKPGKKLWIWGLSRQGMIWEHLLSDSDGQYTEVQSGRLFNQTSDGSTRTPFKHRGFAPHASEQWTEYWYPVRGIGGMVAASQWGALNVRSSGAGLVVSFLAVQPVHDTLVVHDGENVIRSRAIALAALGTFSDTLPAGTNAAHLRISLGRGKLEYDADPSAAALRRPVTAPADFDWSTAYGHYQLGKERIREREYRLAEPEFARAVALDPNFLPALGELASLALRNGRPEDAVRFAHRALAIDTYDPLANYVFGLASRALRRTSDARDGLDIASQSVEFRSAAWSELAKLYLNQRDLGRARQYALKALDYDRFGLDALQVLALAARLAGDSAAADSARSLIAATDPLGHFVRVELFLGARERSAQRGAESTAVIAALRNEMPHETLLEVAAWYHDVGQDRAADRVLSLAVDQPEVLYWRAWLRKRLGELDAASFVTRAETLTPRLVFPFRTETAAVLRWAFSRHASWQTAYYLALVEANLGNADRARALLVEAATTPTVALFYAARAQMIAETDPVQSLVDWRRAMALDTTEWRYGRAVAERLLYDKHTEAAVTLSGDYARRFPGKPPLGMLHARALLAAGRASDAAVWMDRLEVLPAEGAAEAHALYREANLIVALERLGAHTRRGALDALARTGKAREWPERLGTGKPYPADVDERLEDWIEALALVRLGRRENADAAWGPVEAVVNSIPAGSDDITTRVLRAWHRIAPDSR